jgi:CheY-like chemotaxis protein
MKILKRILLVEDNLKDIDLTLAALSEHNLVNEVVVARDGVEALDYLYCRGQFSGREPGLPAVMLLDIKMPRMNGLEVLRIMKSDNVLRLLPVVMLTSSREEPDLVASYALGVNAYVVKPVDFAQFIDAVKQVGAFWAVLNEPPPSNAHTP